MKLVVFNKSEHQREIPVENPDGTRDFVFIQPKSKVKLEKGVAVESVFLKQNAPLIATHDLEAK
jgi:hypothetical protein